MASEKAIAAIGGAVPLKFVQISTTSQGTGGDTEFEIFGLTAEGAVYRYCVDRERKKKDQGVLEYGPWYHWWQPLRMSDQKGAEYEPPATPKEFL
jgi:hypothetical protein